MGGAKSFSDRRQGASSTICHQYKPLNDYRYPGGQSPGSDSVAGSRGEDVAERPSIAASSEARSPMTRALAETSTLSIMIHHGALQRVSGSLRPPQPILVIHHLQIGTDCSNDDQ
jgi:hypothetical protein